MVLVTRVRIFCTTLFTNNIKIVIKSHTFLFHLCFLVVAIIFSPTVNAFLGSDPNLWSRNNQTLYRYTFYLKGL